jgi:hypothetical protein
MLHSNGICALLGCARHCAVLRHRTPDDGVDCSDKLQVSELFGERYPPRATGSADRMLMIVT